MHTEDEFRSLVSDFHHCRAVLAALGDENRLLILYQMMITAKPMGMRVAEIVGMSNLSRPAVSHHMKILKLGSHAAYSMLVSGMQAFTRQRKMPQILKRRNSGQYTCTARR